MTWWKMQKGHPNDPTRLFTFDPLRGVKALFGDFTVGKEPAALRRIQLLSSSQLITKLHSADAEETSAVLRMHCFLFCSAASPSSTDKHPLRIYQGRGLSWCPLAKKRCSNAPCPPLRRSQCSARPAGRTGVGVATPSFGHQNRAPSEGSSRFMRNAHMAGGKHE